MVSRKNQVYKSFVVIGLKKHPPTNEAIINKMSKKLKKMRLDGPPSATWDKQMLRGSLTIKYSLSAM